MPRKFVQARRIVWSERITRQIRRKILSEVGQADAITRDDRKKGKRVERKEDRSSERNKEIVGEIGRTGCIRSNRAASFGERRFSSRRLAAIGRASRAVERRSDANELAASDISGACEAKENIASHTRTDIYIYALYIYIYINMDGDYVCSYIGKLA